VQQDGILANIEDASIALRDQSVNAPRWFLAFGCLAGLYVAVAMLAGPVQQLLGDTALQRRRAAPGRARRRLQDAGAESEQHQLRKAADHVRDAMVGLIADVVAVDEAGLTSDEATRQLKDRAADPLLVQRLASLLEHCDRARYGASEAELHGLVDEARTLLDDLLKALRSKKLL
jgi:hypothetical protein